MCSVCGSEKLPRVSKNCQGYRKTACSTEKLPTVSKNCIQYRKKKTSESRPGYRNLSRALNIVQGHGKTVYGSEQIVVGIENSPRVPKTGAWYRKPPTVPNHRPGYRTTTIDLRLWAQPHQMKGPTAVGPVGPTVMEPTVLNFSMGPTVLNVKKHYNTFRNRVQNPAQIKIS